MWRGCRRSHRTPCATAMPRTPTTNLGADRAAVRSRLPRGAGPSALMCGRRFRTWHSARTPALGGHVSQCDHCGEVDTTIIPAATEAVLSVVAASGRPGWPNVRPTCFPCPTSTWSSPCPTNSGDLVLGNRELMYRLLFATAKETLLEVAADPNHLGARSGHVEGVAHLGSEAGTSSPRSLCGPWGRVGGAHPTHGGDGNRVGRPGATLGVLPARLVLARAGAEPGLPRQVPGGLAAGLPRR